MDALTRVDSAVKAWAWSWLGLALTLGLHVVDEAANDFLSFWNPLVRSLRREIPVLPLPTFSFELWLGGLIAAVLILLALTRFVRRGALWMRPVSYALAVIMLANGTLHIAATIYEGRAAPGVYSSPILLIAAVFLLVATERHRRASTSAWPLAITLRHAGPHDNVLLAEIGAETFSDTFGPYNNAGDMESYLRASFGPEIQAAEIADPRSLFLIAEVDGEAVGYAHLFEGAPPASITGTHPIEIVRFYARTRWIGRGVGAALMQACLTEAQARACDTIWLDVWEENGKARTFYEKWDFTNVGTQPFRLGGDIQNDLLMQRPVTLKGNG
jgi:GNAT superfamily N-acetyltransferase